MRFTSTIIFCAVVAATSGLAASIRDPEFYRRYENTEYTSLTRRTVPLQCGSHNNQVICSTTHQCLSASARPTRIPGAHATLNSHCETECSCRQPLGEISGNVQKKGSQRAPSRSPSPRRHRREVEDMDTSLTRRTVPLQCGSHNNQVICSTTHQCLSASARPTRIPGAHATLNSHCETECSCRQPLGEISGNVQKKGSQRAPSRSPSPRRHRRDIENVDTSLTRRNVPLQCGSHNNQVICPTTHQCLSASGRPTRIPGAHATLNSHCETECSCRQPLGEISGNEQRKGSQSRRPASPRRH
ncbi:hypothetical protein CVT25_006909 [Psilocybe cyanescens]|uniref:Uncharacterized protein n=1 Tax=Psilocybe cyanescens TaxID=93625 RepID=A0A409X670_PSICY|nr:hypothetical protein CVT25_006909 [Psilocybe cyanescens]